MKRHKLLLLWNTLVNLANVKGSIEFLKFVIINKNALINEISLIQEITDKREIPEKYLEYEIKLKEIGKKYGLKNPDGTYIVVNNQFQFDADGERKVRIEKSKLDEEYSDVLKKHDKMLKDFEAFMSESVDVTLTKCKLSKIPDNALTPKQLELLMELDLIED